MLAKDIVLAEADEPLDYAYCPDRDLGSVVASVVQLHQVEAASLVAKAGGRFAPARRAGNPAEALPSLQ